MSKQPLGKTLLRNVIRHTDAHNKIQEEMDMWKMRTWEVHKHSPATKSVRNHMHCDRVPDQPPGLGRSRERVSEHDDRDARYYSRKLYEYEAKDPDRWGHSGFKELYPEEFESDSEKNTRKIGRHKMKRSKSDTEASLSKRSKKSSRRKKKKKKKKEESSSDGSSSSDDDKHKQSRKGTKSRHKNKKARGRDEDGASGDSHDEGEAERRTHSHKKRKQDSHKDSNSKRKKSRKDWRAAGEESVDGSSGD